MTFTRILIASLGTASLLACALAVPAETVKTSQTYQKPGIPLTLTQGKTATVQPNETAQASLILTASEDSTVELGLASKTGLDILGASNRTLTLSADTPRTVLIDVRSAQSGRHYLDVTASLSGMAGSRAISLPVQVGEGGVIGKATPGTINTAPDGTPTISMPAAETINGVVVRDPANEQLEPK